MTPASAFARYCGCDGCPGEKQQQKRDNTCSLHTSVYLPRRLSAVILVDGTKLCRLLERRSRMLSSRASCRWDESYSCLDNLRMVVVVASLARSETKEQSFVRLSGNFNWFSPNNCGKQSFFGVEVEPLDDSSTIWFPFFFLFCIAPPACSTNRCNYNMREKCRRVSSRCPLIATRWVKTKCTLLCVTYYSGKGLMGMIWKVGVGLIRYHYDYFFVDVPLYSVTFWGCWFILSQFFEIPSVKIFSRVGERTSNPNRTTALWERQLLQPIRAPPQC